MTPVRIFEPLPSLTFPLLLSGAATPVLFQHSPLSPSDHGVCIFLTPCLSLALSAQEPMPLTSSDPDGTWK